MSLRNFVLSFLKHLPASEPFHGQHSRSKMSEANAMSSGGASRKRFASTIGINTLVDARYYGEDEDDNDFYPGVVVGFSRTGYMVEFDEYEGDAWQDTKPEDVRVYGDEKPVQTSAKKINTSRQSDQDQKLQLTEAIGLPYLLPLGDKRKNKPYTCSMFCETNRFYHCGGCPTCNDYYKSIGRRNPHVLLDKRKTLVQQYVPDLALVEKHYAEVCRKNPLWLKDDKGIPIVPMSFVPFTVPKAGKMHSKKARREVAYQAHDDAVHAALVSDKTNAMLVEPVPYKCSYSCSHGAFSMYGGCPTCNEYYKAIGAKNPFVTAGVEQKSYTEELLRKHYADVRKYNPQWAKDDNGIPVVPKTYIKAKN